MQIEFATEGGVAFFPGLNKAALIDSDQLPQADAAQLRRLLDDADFFAQPARPRRPAAGAADYQSYSISVRDGPRHHRILISDPIENPALQQLVDFLRSHTRPGG